MVFLAFSSAAFNIAFSAARRSAAGADPRRRHGREGARFRWSERAVRLVRVVALRPRVAQLALELLVAAL